MPQYEDRIIARIEVRHDFGSTAAVRFGRRINGKLHVAKPIVFEEVPDHQAPPDEPALYLNGAQAEEFFQELMDQLWKQGIRPQEIGTPGHLAATQSHLSDMRKLVEKTLEVKF